MPFLPAAVASAASSLGWINVKDHGATGTGLTDDTAAIASAIAAVPPTGGVLYVPAGTYVTSGGFTLATPVLVRGDGGFVDYNMTKTPSTITCTSGTANLFDVTSDWAKFEDIVLLNTSPTTPTAGAGILVHGGTYDGKKVDYNNITVAKFYINIDVQVGWGWSLTSSYIFDPVLYGLRTQNTVTPDAGGWTVHDCRFLTGIRSSTSGIEILGGGGGRLSSNKFVAGVDGTKLFTYGIRVKPPGNVNTADLLIETCSFECAAASGFNILIDLTSGATWPWVSIVGNQFATDGPGVCLLGSATNHVKNAIIADNAFSCPINQHVVCTYAASCAIVDNITDTGVEIATLTNCTNMLVRSHPLKNAPLCAVGAQNGSAAPPPTLESGSIDQSGAVTFGSGTGPAAGAQVVVSWGGNWSQTPRIFLTPLNAATAALGLYVSAVSRTGSFTISSLNAPADAQAATTYSVQYLVVE